MTHDELIHLLNHPDTVEVGHIADLKEMISYYPYFSQIRILLSKAMLKTANLHANSVIQQTALYAPDRRNFYYFLYPDKKINTEQIPKERVPRYNGSYFDMLQFAENAGEDPKQSLRNLAQKLKAARESISEKTAKKASEPKPNAKVSIRIPTPEYFNLETEADANKKQVSEEYVKELIKEKKYKEAIEILRKLNLINPKKSIYFADQIRFLEKILVNTKK